MSALENQVVTDWLFSNPDWKGGTDGITATFTWSDFPAVIAFMSACVEGIESRQHHPEWANVYNRLTITLKTHDAGDRVTQKDLDLAAWLSEQAKGSGASAA